MSPDVDLLEAWIEGDVRAAEALIARYFDRLYAFFRNKVDDGEHEVEDLIQSTFKACVTYRERFRQASSFKAYLFTTARHELYAYLRGRQRRAELDDAVVSVHALHTSPTGVVARHQEQRLLLEGLRRLPLQLQVVLELHYWQDLTTAELAEVLEIPQGTVKSRLIRARGLLEAELAAIAEDGAVLESTMGDLERWAHSLREKAPRE